MALHFEQVYTVIEYYDGPREGVADFGSAPHMYRSCAMDAEPWDPDDTRFLLWPISGAALKLALEEWAIWRRWEDAFHAGLVDESTHPALPDDRPRYEELAAQLTAAVRENQAHAIIATGEFRAKQPVPNTPRGILYPLEVRWSLVESVPPAI